jgi:hypothetical protein
MTIQLVNVTNLLDTRFVLVERQTGKKEIRYTEAGSAEPLDRLLAINPELDRNDCRIISPEFKTCAGLQDYVASLTSAAAA